MSTEEALSVPITKGGFSNDGSEIIQRTLETSAAAASFRGVSKTLYCSGIPLGEYYEIDQILEFILRTGAKKVRFECLVNIPNCFFSLRYFTRPFYARLYLRLTFLFEFLNFFFVVIGRASVPG